MPTPIGLMNEVNPIDVIPNVLRAWTMQEADIEVSPIVVADDNQAAYWSTYTAGVGSYDIALANDTVHKLVGVDCLALTVGAGTKQTVGIQKDFGSNQNWSTEQFVRFRWTGQNTNLSWTLVLYCPDSSNKRYMSFTDNFLGTQIVSLPYSSFTTNAGSPNWATVRQAFLYTNPTAAATWYLDRVIVDVPPTVVDYSGNGNNGTPTGTSIVAGKFVGTNARNIAVGEKLAGVDSASMRQAGASAGTLCFWVKFTAFTTVSNQFIFGRNSAGNNRFEIYNQNAGDGLYVFVKTATATCEHIMLTKTALLNAWHLVTITYDGSNVNSYIDTATSHTPIALTGVFDNIAVTGGVNNFGDTNTSGIFSTNMVFNTNLTLGQISNIYGGYSDPTIETSKIIVKPWARNTTLKHGYSWEESQNSNLLSCQTHINMDVINS